MDPKEIVRSGYDVVSMAYRADDAPDEAYGDWLAELALVVPEGARVLDLGCGCGVPTDRWLVARGYSVTGVDLSDVQIERARRLVPGAEFIRADMTTLDFPAASFDAVVSLYAIIHVPVAEQAALLRSVYRWLRPGGALLAIVGRDRWTGTEDNWLDAGATMFWSHEATPTYLAWLSDAGFEIRWNRFIPEVDGDQGHALILATAC